MSSCAKSNLKKVSLELGGKSPLIIFSDFDLDKAVRIAMGSVFFNKVKLHRQLPKSKFFQVKGQIVLLSNRCGNTIIKTGAMFFRKCAISIFSYLPMSPYLRMSTYLPTSTYVYLPTYVYLRLPTSTYVYLPTYQCLPTFRYLSL